MPLPSTIAIDGPAASGKTTLGKKLADELGYLLLDTGVMYRAITWAALQRSVPLQDEAAVSALAETCVIDIRPASRSDGRPNDVRIDGEDISWDIRRPEVDANVSLVSSYAGVRRALTAQQRRIGGRGRVVMVGRDIGTVVLPDADLKIYLDASAEERAHRRYLEVLGRGNPADYDQILQAMRARDAFDSSRDLSPLCAAEDAHVIDSDGLDIESVLEHARGFLALDC
jgi:cytidylate kinase